MTVEPAARRPHGRWLVGVLIVSVGLGLGLGWLLFGPPALGSQTETPLFTTLPAPAHVSSAPAPVANAPAPEFSLMSLDGSPVSLSQFSGQPVLINFWASWCPPCRLEMPDLVKDYEAHQAEGFVLLGINVTSQDSLPDVRAFVKEFGMTFPVLLDEAGTVESLYRLRGLPLSVFVDRQGIISRINIGAMSADQIDKYIGEILK